MDTPYFNSFSWINQLKETEINELLMDGIKHTYRKETVFVEAGDEARHLYVILSGYVKISQYNEKGTKVTIGVFSKEDVIGDALLLLDKAYPFCCETITECKVIKISRQRVLEILRKYPQIAIEIAISLSKRLLMLAHMIRNQNETGTMMFKVCKSLMDLEANLPHEHINRKLLAEIAGCSRETLSRILSKLSKEGVIQLDKRSIRLVNKSYLAKLKIM